KQFAELTVQIEKLTATVDQLAKQVGARVEKSRSIEPDAVYSADEAAFFLALNPVTLRQKLQLGVVKGSKRLGEWRIRGSELLKQA
ncbi:MAG: hypothetical protein V4671_34095, partial [Armatimonadota bacterium]